MRFEKITRKARWVLVWLSIGFSQLVFADTSVWKAEKNGNIVYLGGTIHVLRAKDYPLPAAFEKAYKNAQAVTFETDIASLSAPSMQMEMIKMLSYSDDRTVKSVVSNETYQQLKTVAESLGMSLEFFRKAKPGMLMSALMVAELQKLGVTQEGIDMFFTKKAQTDNKPIYQLESPQEQVQFLASLGDGNEEAFYKNLLSDLENTQSQFLDMLKHWREGNSEALNELVNIEMKAQYPAMYKTLLLDRNNRWMPIVESYFKTQEVEFVLVGAAHLIGKDGLVTQLRSKGYKVEKLN